MAAQNEVESSEINVLRAIEDNAPRMIKNIEIEMDLNIQKLVELSREHTHYTVLNKLIEALK